MAYTDKPYREWLDKTAAAVASQSVPAEWDKSGPIDMEVRFRILKPKTSKLLYPKPDIDNYEKSIMDAMTQAGHVWDDDCQVVDLRSSKRFVTNPDFEGIIVTLRSIQPEEL